MFVPTGPQRGFGVTNRNSSISPVSDFDFKVAKVVSAIFGQPVRPK